MCKKASNKVTALGRIARIIPFHKRRLLFKTFIESQFSYCPLVWMFCSKKMNKKINRLHKNYTSTFEELLKEDESFSIHHRNIHCLATEMYKVKNDLSPSFMKEIFSYNEKRDKFFLPYARTTKMGQGSLRSFGPIVWNTMLPENLKESPSLNIFKDCIKSWIPNNCKCRLCNDHNNNCSCDFCKLTPRTTWSSSVDIAKGF